MIKSEYKKMFLLEETHFWFLAKRYFVKVYLGNVKGHIKTILDVGAGTGGLTKFLEQYGNVTGVEKNEYARSLAHRRGLNITKGEAENLPFKDNSFNLITMFDVLYHEDVLKVEGAVDEAYRTLKPGGYILITDSAFNFLKGSHSFAVKEKRRFNLQSLEKTVTEGGFKVIKSSYIYSTIFPLVFFKRFLLDRIYRQTQSDVKQERGLINSILLMILRLESVIINFVSLPFGSSLIILAKSEKN